MGAWRKGGRGCKGLREREKVGDWSSRGVKGREIEGRYARMLKNFAVQKRTNKSKGRKRKQGVGAGNARYG